ncbi:MAG: hypothetical protein JSV10_03690 [Candidatus Zixiibacteriota bacterium]|nr:MAG: hypothetical protein JSV10_03690 [candidate division Zixibacteria bacterium]
MSTEAAELVFITVLAVANLAAGFGFSVPIARLLGRVAGKPQKFSRYFSMLLGIYLLECVAFPAGMATQIFSIGLAFVWGLVLGLWLRGRAPSSEVRKASFFVALFTCAPTASFGLLLLVVKLFGGSNVLSMQEGTAFGIPYFVPWPLNTILGFCAALVLGTVVLKTAITTGEVSLLIHLGKKPTEGSRRAV